MTITGVDVSHWNPEPLPWIAWKVRVGVVGIKITGGLLPDAQANVHRLAAKAAGYKVLFGYHYLLMMPGQAAVFIEALGPDFQFGMLDVEEQGLTESIMQAFCNYYDAHETRPLVLYGNSGLLAKLIAQNPTRYKRYKIVWAEYGPDTPTSVPPYAAPHVSPGLELAAWQYAGQGGRLSPYTKAIDLSVWYAVPGEDTIPPPPDDNTALKAAIRGHASEIDRLVS